MSRNLQQRQRGMSLIELMIAITLGLVLIGVTVSLLTSNLRANSTNLRYTRLNQDLRGTLNAVVNDISRAGYWALAGDVVHVASLNQLRFSATTGAVTITGGRPDQVGSSAEFLALLNRINFANSTLVILLPTAGGGTTRVNLTITAEDNAQISATIPGGVTLPNLVVRQGSWTVLNPFAPVTMAGTSCVQFGYDLNENGLRDDNEFFAYRFNAAAGTIQGTSSNLDTCAGNTGWENITDDNVLELTAFSVTPLVVSAVAGNQLTGSLRQYVVELDGRLRQENEAVRSLRSVAKVRNAAYQ